MTGRSAPHGGDISAPGPLRQRRPRGPRARPRWLAVAGYAGLGLACVALAAVAFVLIAPPVGAVRDRLIADVQARTGRTLTVSGPVSVTLLPRVLVSVAGVGLPHPDGGDGAPLLQVSSIEAEMSLWSLLSRRPRFDRLTLHRPIIELSIDAQGRRSWDARPVPQPARGPADAGKAAPPGAAAPGAPAVRARRKPPRPVAVHLVDGIVRYRDARSGVHTEIGALNLHLAADSQDGAVTVSGTFAVGGEQLAISGTVSGTALRPGETAQMALHLEGAPVDASYQGTLALTGGIAAEGALKVARLAYKDLKLGPAAMTLALQAGVAKVNFQEIELYGGRGVGSLTVDTAGAAPAVAASLKLADLSVLPLLKDASGVAWLDGRGALELALSARGSSEREILETLQGQVQVAVADGGVTGFDIDRSLNAVQRGRLDRVAPRRRDRTPFSSLTGTFDIAGGVARNQDLKLVSTHLQLSGQGAIEFLPRRIDYTLLTKIEGGAPAEPAEGAVIRVGTLELPVSITGPLERPEFTIKGYEGLTDTIRQIGKNLRSREVQDALKGLLSGDSDKRVKPGDLIEKLLKKE